MTITEFRARLASGEDGPLVRAYRALAGRPDLRRRAAGAGEWAMWTGAPDGSRAALAWGEWSAASAGWVVWPDGGRAAAAR
jgi:hypothetical protein